LWATTKKGRQLFAIFGEEKCTPDKIVATRTFGSNPHLDPDLEIHEGVFNVARENILTI